PSRSEGQGCGGNTRSIVARRLRSIERRRMHMAWNEPGKRDPWKGRQEPPNVDDFVRRLRQGLRRIFGSGGPAHAGSFLILVPAVVAIWIALSSFTIIDARQIGVVLRFGQFNRIMNNGLNFKWPTPIEEVLRVDATNQQSISDEVRMLTKDENIV